jgi:hypothetical protein
MGGGLWLLMLDYTIQGDMSSIKEAEGTSKIIDSDRWDNE